MSLSTANRLEIARIHIDDAAGLALALEAKAHSARAIGHHLAQARRMVEEASYHVGLLEAAIIEPDAMPLALGLTRREAQVISFLMRRDRADRDQILDALCGLSPKADEPDRKIIDVFISKARRKLALHGLEILTIWGQGYALPPATKAAIRAMQAAQREVAA